MKVKKLFLAMLLVVFVFTGTAYGFSDINNHWAKDTVNWGVNEGIANGFPDGTFRPDGKVTESQFLALLVRTFTDIEDGSPWYKPYYAFAENSNYPVLNKQDSVILRTQVAEIVAGTQGANLSGDNAVAFLLARGLARGKVVDETSIDSYGGNDSLTRAEALQFIRNLVVAGIEEIKERPFEVSNPEEVMTNEEYADYLGLISKTEPPKNRPEADLDRQGWLTNEQDRYFRDELQKTIVVDRENNTLSFYLPVLPEGFDWDVRLNYHYAPGLEDSHYVLYSSIDLADGKTYTFSNIEYSRLDRGYFSFGTAKIGLVSAYHTGLDLVTDKYDYYEREW